MWVFLSSRVRRWLLMSVLVPVLTSTGRWAWRRIQVRRAASHPQAVEGS